MSEKSTCIFCGNETTVESISGQDAYRVECLSCGIYDSSEFIDSEFKEMNDEDKQAVSDFIKDCHEKNEIPELHKLQGTGELAKIIEEYKDR
jgi:Zn ribbon nucleic-acid-binding protein